MNNLIISVVAWWIAEGSNLVQTAKFKMGIKGRVKPFDCPMCLAFWIGLFFNAIDTRDLLLTIVYAILCSSIAILISKVYTRL